MVMLHSIDGYEPSMVLDPSVIEESIVLETNPFSRAIDLAGHPNTLLVYFPFCTPRGN